MHKFLLSTLLISTLSIATDALPKMHCTLSQEGSVAINWKAYKTPLFPHIFKALCKPAK